MLDGYRLRCQYLPRLKTTPGWVEYLDALMALHFPRWATGTVHSFRRRADHLCCAGESPVRATKLKARWGHRARQEALRGTLAASPALSLICPQSGHRAAASTRKQA